jgi:hypothetical protein
MNKARCALQPGGQLLTPGTVQTLLRQRDIN